MQLGCRMPPDLDLTGQIKRCKATKIEQNYRAY